jgi:exonuclease III
MTSSTLRLISWNTGGRTGCCKQQLSELKQRAPDLVALQEVRPSIVDKLQAGFNRMGLSYCADTAHLTRKYERTYSVLIASRWPLEVLPANTFRIPQPERVCSAVIASPWGPIELHGVHLPNGARYRWKKVQTFEGLYEYLACVVPHPRILCGDLNTPQAERADGEIITWGQDIVEGKAVIWDKWHGDSGARWDRAERSILAGLAAHDLPDVYRQLHGYGPAAQAYSYIKKGDKMRYDHIFASRSLNATSCEYLLEPLNQRLSDHAPVEALFAP